MIYGYIRVSSDKQTTENQRYEISCFCKMKQICVDNWIEETISGTQNYTKRRLGRLLRRVVSGDIIICSELSRLGRTLFMIMDILNLCMQRGCRVWTVKDNYRLGDNLKSKVLAFAFGISAEIERNLISQRTREALARRRAEGKQLGRPKGTPNRRSKLDGQEARIRRMIASGISISCAARKLHVSRNTLSAFIRSRKLLEPAQK